jgi:hypothetical protein
MTGCVQFACNVLLCMVVKGRMVCMHMTTLQVVECG